MSAPVQQTLGIAPDGRRAFDHRGLLALDPVAFLGMFDQPARPAPRVMGAVAIVDVRGPIEHHVGSYFDNYEEIQARVRLACESEATTVVLRIDSPGGLVSGCFETVDAISACVKAAGKTLVAFVDGMAASAAYALACSADRIVASRTARVGSIGVLDTRVDLTAMDAAFGTKFTFITSGARKTYGNPHTAVSEAELAHAQATVDGLAAVFFDVVAQSRGVSADSVAALEAGVLRGEAAVAAGLADEIQSFETLLATLASTEERSMSTKLKDARAALEETAKGDGEDAKKAKRALAALDASDSDDDNDDEESAESSDDEEEEEPAASAPTGTVSAASAASVATQANTFEGRLTALERERESDRRSAIINGRPDLNAGLKATLATMPLADVERIVANMPKPPKAKPAATATVAATQGAHQGDTMASQLPPEAKRALDLEMGVIAMQSTGIERSPYKLTLGAAEPVTLKQRNAG